MAAGLGFKTFVSGEVLTAADTNGYLMQGILVFASASARNAAITSPQEGQFCFLKDTNSTEFYDGAAWIAGVEGDISGVTAGVGISGGGTSGTVTVTNSMATAIDAKGDLVPGTGADAFSRLAVGANFAFLQSDSAQATGLVWNIAAFVAYTPTISSGGGTLTTASAVGKYLRVGKMCVVKIAATITTAGTGTGTITVSLPFTSVSDGNTFAAGSFRENNVTGTTGVGRVGPNVASVNINQYDDSTFIANGRLVVGTITYEVA